MGRWLMDRKGHVIAHENEYGDIIVDDKRALGGSSIGNYEKPQGGGVSIHLPGNVLFFVILLTTFFFGGLLVLLAWLFFATGVAITLTVIFVAVLIGLGIFMFLG